MVKVIERFFSYFTTGLAMDRASVCTGNGYRITINAGLEIALSKDKFKYFGSAGPN